MKLVFAVSSNKPLNQVLDVERVPYLLCSKLFLKSMQPITYQPEYFLLDSGAYSVWKSGATVELADYSKTLLEMITKWPHTIAINLDVIPGSPGQKATSSQIEAAMQESLQNADALRLQGYNVMEVFHMGEPFGFLKHLLERRPSDKGILGISPRKDKGQKAQQEWLQTVLAYLVEHYGKEHLPRTHGLGVTSVDLLRSFPFYSADSTSWANAQIFGQRLNEKGRLELIDKTMGQGASRSKDCVSLHVRRAIQGYCHMEREITTLWERRGIVWTD